LQDSILVETRFMVEERLWQVLDKSDPGEVLQVRGPPIYLLRLTWYVDFSLLLPLTTVGLLLLEPRGPTVPREGVPAEPLAESVAV
jgi:hypothetical protein